MTGGVRPCASDAFATSPHKAPAWASRKPPSSRRTRLSVAESMTIPSSTCDCPYWEWPRPRIAILSSCLFANLTARTMSSADFGRSTAMGIRRTWPPRSDAAPWRAASSNSISPSKLGRLPSRAAPGVLGCDQARFGRPLAPTKAVAAASFTNERRVARPTLERDGFVMVLPSRMLICQLLHYHFLDVELRRTDGAHRLHNALTDGENVALWPIAADQRCPLFG